MFDLFIFEPETHFRSDVCTRFVEICVAERGFEAVVCDGLQLAWRPSSADVVLCIAVLHHISTGLTTLCLCNFTLLLLLEFSFDFGAASEARRLALIKELLNVVRVEGKILLEV